MSNSTPSTPPEDEQAREQAEAAPEEEPRAAEARLHQLKRDVEDMLEVEDAPVFDLPGRKLDHLPESITPEQAARLYLRWLEVQVMRHWKRPDLYGPIRNHNVEQIKRMLAYCADKTMRVREIRDETGELRDRHQSPHASWAADEIASGCESLEEIYSMTGDYYGRTIFPVIEKRGLR